MVINRLGLADAEGEIALYVTSESDTESSTLRAAVEFAAKDQGLSGIVETTARVTTGDAYLRSHAIAHVDLLKIDVEGPSSACCRASPRASPEARSTWCSSNTARSI